MVVFVRFNVITLNLQHKLYLVNKTYNLLLIVKVVIKVPLLVLCSIGTLCTTKLHLLNPPSERFVTNILNTLTSSM